ncbi:ribonuclease E/G [Histidinibacterium aquaticum]|uniref:Ribonuclease G n=1 Tax=Histidinibacterium aquaticum TaxID=2613962 RepID=A0A5J5GPR1_9RHOB|nr:ribonuclease E/G [Histidinibacterium aquaticum]KAA9010045.1 ribonuclease G [Histidinibacterium aquaticum]
MKGRRIILDHLGGVEAAALLVDGELDDLLVDDPSRPRPGAIYRAICDRPMKGQGGMTVRLPGGSGFLRQAKGLSPGQPILVMVTGFSEDGKALPVTSRVLFKSRYAIVTPDKPGLNISRQIREDEERVRLKEIALEATLPGGAGLILRSSCEGAEAGAIAEDISAMASLAAAVLEDADGPEPEALTEGDGPHLLAWREWTEPADVVTEPGGFEREGVLDELDRVGRPEVPLGQGSMAVEPTRALVAVDVNTGRDTSPAAALKANLAAARLLPRALRLRGLGGQIVVDFVPVSKAHRTQVEQALRAAFRACPVETSLVGWTSLGLFELQRKKERARVSAVLGEPE